MWKRKFRNAHNSRPGRQRPSRRVRLVDLTGLELLDRRILPAVTATFSAAQGVLTVIGDAHDNTIVVSRDAAGSILVNGGAVTILGGKRHGRQHQPDPDLRPGRQRQPLPRRDQRRLAASQSLRRRRQRHAHRRLGQRPALRPGRQRHPARARAATTCCSAATATTC